MTLAAKEVGSSSSSGSWQAAADSRGEVKKKNENPEKESAEDLPFRGPRGAREENPENKTTLIDHAYQLFCHHLEQLRQYAEIKTICMHGSPKSKYDSKDIWENRQGAGQGYDYRALGIIGEPYFEIDFDEVFYLTDTGRRWDGWKVSLRDKAGA